MQFFLIDETIAVDVNTVESLSLRQATIFDGDAQLIDDLGGWDFFVVHRIFEFRVQFVIFVRVLLNLLDREETSEGRHEFLPRDLTISVQIDNIDPLPYLVARKFRQQFLLHPITYM